MGISLIERINQKGTKSYYGYGNYGFPSQSLAKNRQDLIDSHYSYALAYLYIEPIRVAIDKYAQAAGRVPYVLYEDDKPIARSDDTNVTHPFMKMLRNHRKHYYIGFFPAMVYEQILYDELFVEMLHPEKSTTRLMQNDIVNGLRVLRGAATMPQFSQGELQSLYYGGDDKTETLNVDDIVYDKGYHPLSDYHGASRIQSVLDEANITNQFRRFLQRLLKKADRPDIYASGKDGRLDNDRNRKAMEEEFNRYRNNPDETVIAGTMPLDFTAIPRPDANNQMEVSDSARQAIYRAFSINPALAGDTTSTSYKDEHAAIYSNWIKLDLMFYLQQGDEIINDVLLPKLFPDSALRLEHDTSEFDIVTSEDKAKIEAADMVLNSGGITYRQYLERIGGDVDDMPKELLDCVSVEGIPVPVANVRELWRYKFQVPATEQLAQAQLNREKANETNANSQIAQETATDVTENEEDGLASILPSGTFKQNDQKSHDLIDHDHHEETIQVDEHHSVGVKAFNPIKTTPQDELTACRNFALKYKGKREFNYEWLAGSISDVIKNGLKEANGNYGKTKILFDNVETMLTARFKAIETTERKFKSAFNKLLASARSGDTKRVTFKRELKQLISEYGTQAYIDGMAEGGVEVSVSREEFSDSDKANIKRLINDQDTFITKLANAIYKEASVTDAMAANKGHQWFSKSILPFRSEGLLSANENVMLEFGGKDGKKPCKDCKRLKGQRHRAKDWARKRYRPRQDKDNFECGAGGLCQHKLFRVFAPARGSW